MFIAPSNSSPYLAQNYRQPSSHAAWQKYSRIQLENVYFFTDSTITLAWIQSPSRDFKPYVSARIGEIQSDTNPSQRRHIPGEDNVADDLSRGITVNELSGRWMKGPEFLSLPQEEWPNGTPPPANYI